MNEVDSRVSRLKDVIEVDSHVSHLETVTEVDFRVSRLKDVTEVVLRVSRLEAVSEVDPPQVAPQGSQGGGHRVPGPVRGGGQALVTRERRVGGSSSSRSSTRSS